MQRNRPTPNLIKRIYQTACDMIHAYGETLTSNSTSPPLPWTITFAVDINNCGREF